MPDLPTITITNQAHYDRLVAALPGTTGAEKAAAYRRYVINCLRDYVREHETVTIDADLNVEKIARVEALLAGLPPFQPEPELPARP